MVSRVSKLGENDDTAGFGQPSWTVLAWHEIVGKRSRPCRADARLCASEWLRLISVLVVCLPIRPELCWSFFGRRPDATFYIRIQIGVTFSDGGFAAYFAFAQIKNRGCGWWQVFGRLFGSRLYVAGQLRQHRSSVKVVMNEDSEDEE